MNIFKRIWFFVNPAAASAAAKQAELDRVMLEHCPNEMTSAQIRDWGLHQRAEIEVSLPPLTKPDWQPLPPVAPGAGMGRRNQKSKPHSYDGALRRKTDQPKKVETPTRVDHRGSDFLAGAVVGAVLSSPKRESSYSSSQDDYSSVSSSWSSTSSDSGSSFGGGGGDSGGGGSSGSFD